MIYVLFYKITPVLSPSIIRIFSRPITRVLSFSITQVLTCLIPPVFSHPIIRIFSRPVTCIFFCSMICDLSSSIILVISFSIIPIHSRSKTCIFSRLILSCSINCALSLDNISLFLNQSSLSSLEVTSWGVGFDVRKFKFIFRALACRGVSVLNRFAVDISAETWLWRLLEMELIGSSLIDGSSLTYGSDGSDLITGSSLAPFISRAFLTAFSFSQFWDSAWSGGGRIVWWWSVWRIIIIKPKTDDLFLLAIDWPLLVCTPFDCWTTRGNTTGGATTRKLRDQ